MNRDQEELLNALRKRNTEPVSTVEEDHFRLYGRIAEIPGLAGLTDWAEKTIDPEGPVYIAHYPSSEKQSWKRLLEQDLAGGMPLEIGSCCGNNTKMNGMEYHKGHEYIVALTPLVLFLGFSGDIRKGGEAGWEWDSSKGHFFFVPRGTAVELYSTTLHLAPCRTGRENFRSLIILPEGTNTELEDTPAPGSLLFMKNKWMICHPDSPAASRGACPGIRGENRSISPLEE
ncbi:MAG: DUF4867 family protein [Spirochaetales bacterium]|nr:DUF4867 family protein [Spirochaetales bacterium]